MNTLQKRQVIAIASRILGNYFPKVKFIRKQSYPNLVILSFELAPDASNFQNIDWDEIQQSVMDDIEAIGLECDNPGPDYSTASEFTIGDPRCPLDIKPNGTLEYNLFIDR